MKSNWLAKWLHPAAIAYRASLEMGSRIGKDAEFILSLMAAADVIHSSVSEQGRAVTFDSFFKAVQEGENFEAEAERVFARIVAPLLLGKSKERARLRRLIESAEQKANNLALPKTDAPRLLLRVATSERLKARKNRNKMPSLDSIIQAFKEAGGTLDTKGIKRHLRKMGVEFEPMRSRGKDKKVRTNRGAAKE